MKDTINNLEIFDYGMNGEGVGKRDGKVILVENALKNEIINCIITKDYDNYATAQIEALLTESSNRETPPCPYFGKCGGCNLQHMAYNEQLNFKTELVKKTLKKIANIDCKVSNTISSDYLFEYRNKVSFDVKNGICGFFKKESKDLIEINKCLLLNDNFNKILNIFQNFLKKHQKNAKFVKNLVIREINSQILICVVTKEKIDLSNFILDLKTQVSNFGLFELINKRNDSVVLSGKANWIHGLKKIDINNFNLNYQLDILSFHQTNLDIQDKLYNKVLDAISKNTIVINGFSGQGLLSAIIAQKAKYVYGIEINTSAHKQAENLKATNQIKNLTNICGDFHKEFENLTTCDALILDPSKKGCGKDTMKKVKGIREIIYISCNPIALAKDLLELKEDYDIVEIQPFDMFPQTKNVETFVKLKLKEK